MNGSAAESIARSRVQVLALDGGGYKGVFTAAVLAHLEDDLHLRITDHFDLLTGTSTGGIIALGLGAGLTARELTDFYLQHGGQIFTPGRGGRLRMLFRPRYDASGLRSAMEDAFGTRLLGDSSVPLCIPAYDIATDDIVVYRTPHSPRLARDWKLNMVDVGLATSAAPMFFPAHRVDNRNLVDGGLWANNPAIVGLNEAVREFGASLEDVHICSIGTTTDVKERPMALVRGGLWSWRSHLADVALRAQSLGANAAVTNLLGETNVMRINPTVPPGLLGLDKVTPSQLEALASAASRKIADEFRRRFAAHTPRAYTPHHPRASV